MQSVKSLQAIETLYVKNEVITIDEDEIQSMKNDEIHVQEEPHNGGSLIYYFEPQQKSNLIVNTEDKSKIFLETLKQRSSLIFYSFQLITISKNVQLEYYASTAHRQLYLTTG